MSAPWPSGWQGQWPHAPGQSQWWQQSWQGYAGVWQASGASWNWRQGEGDLDANTEPGQKRKVREGGWSQKEGAWRESPAPDGFVIKTLYPSPKSLGDGVFTTLKEDAEDNYAITKIKIRGRDSTAGRQRTRQQGTCSHQLTIIGRDCMYVFKNVFRKAAWDRGLDMPDHVPHMCIPVELADYSDTRPSLPAHPDNAAQRCAPRPPPPSGADRSTAQPPPSGVDSATAQPGEGSGGAQQHGASSSGQTAQERSGSVGEEGGGR